MGQGADDIVLSPGDEDVTVMGFQPGEDKLLVTWEDEADPEIEVEPDAENANLTRVMINGQESGAGIRGRRYDGGRHSVDHRSATGPVRTDGLSPQFPFAIW